MQFVTYSQNFHATHTVYVCGYIVIILYRLLCVSLSPSIFAISVKLSPEQHSKGIQCLEATDV